MGCAFLDTEAGKLKNILYELFCAAFLFVFLFAQTERMLLGPGPVVFSAIIGVVLGAFLLRTLRAFGFTLLPGAICFALISLPLTVFGLYLLGVYLYLLIAVASLTLIFLHSYYGFWRSFALVSMTVFAVPIVLIKPVLTGKIDPGCPFTPEAVLEAGGKIVSPIRAENLLCGAEADSFLALSPNDAELSLRLLSGERLAAIPISKGAGCDLGGGGALAFAWDKISGQGITLDARSGKVLQQVDLSDYACIPQSTITANLHLRTLVLCAKNGRVLFFDTLRGLPLNETEQVAKVPFAVAMNQRLDRAYTSDLFGKKISEIDIETMGVLRQVEVGFSQTDIAVSEDGSTVFIALPLLGSIVAYSAVTWEEQYWLTAPKGVTHLALDDQGNRLFASAFLSGDLYVIDLDDPEIPKKYELVSSILDMIFCEKSGLLFYSTPCEIFYIDPSKLN